VLSDPEKRRKYDQFGPSAFENAGGGGQNFHFAFDDIFRKFEDNFGHNSFHFGGGHQYGEQEHNFFNFEDFFQEVSESASFILLFFVFRFCILLHVLPRLLEVPSLATTFSRCLFIYICYCYMFRPLLAIFRRNMELIFGSY
jgi:hypothetical protein